MSEVPVGLIGDMSSISGRFTDTGIQGTRPEAELFLTGAFCRLPELELALRVCTLDILVVLV